ncbi:MAG: LysM peptidoglycan-binding domain-containing protein [Candidatus Accumulibacter sp.]|jgi:hypothetical protein|nr:LysM peptidoglycan-binding domain-containing protein [Accumulibacter sp.]
MPRPPLFHLSPVLLLAVFGTLSLGSSHAAESAAPGALRLADQAPNQHVVVRGDTLWDISARFLSEPWRWPEIWRMNQDRIKNPHRIYPGDVIFLARDAKGDPLLRLERRDSRMSPLVQEELLTDAIPPIPPNVIEPFIVTPLFVEEDALQSAPRIVATQENRVFLGKGDTAYVQGADPEQKDWQVFRNGRPLYDPEESQRLLGYEAFHLGSVTQLEPGDPAMFEVTEAKQEMGYGDRLVPMLRPDLVDYVPHAPDQLIDGRVVSIYDGIGSGGGRLSIVAINRGENDGIEIGHVLALERNRVVERRDEYDRKESIVIPPRRFGLIFVFRIFGHVSYALVVQADGLIEPNDFVRTP